MIAGTVCGAVILCVIVVSILQFTQPESKGGFAVVGDMIFALMSLMAGFLAGRSGRNGNGNKDINGGARHIQPDKPG